MLWWHIWGCSFFFFAFPSFCPLSDWDLEVTSVSRQYSWTMFLPLDECVKNYFSCGTCVMLCYILIALLYSNAVVWEFTYPIRHIQNHSPLRKPCLFFWSWTWPKYCDMCVCTYLHLFRKWPVQVELEIQIRKRCPSLLISCFFEHDKKISTICQSFKALWILFLLYFPLYRASSVWTSWRPISLQFQKLAQQGQKWSVERCWSQEIYSTRKTWHNLLASYWAFPFGIWGRGKWIICLPVLPDIWLHYTS